MKNIVENILSNKMSYYSLKMDKNYKFLVRINKTHKMLNNYYCKYNFGPKHFFKKFIDAFSKLH